MDHIAAYLQYIVNAQLAKHMVYSLMLTAAANEVVVIIVVNVVIIANVIVPVAVVALAFGLRRPLVLSWRRLVVACYFASVAGIFAARPSFG